MILGTVTVHQIPMLVTFDEKDVEMICTVLHDSLEEAYKYIDFFQFDIEAEDPFEE